MIREYITEYIKNSSEIYRLKNPYYWYVTISLWITLGLTMVLTWAIGRATGRRMGVDFHAPLKFDSSELMFFVLMALIAVVSMLLIGTAITWLSTFIYRSKGWMSRSEVTRMVTHSEYPRRWLR
jgi:hypothetical protein